MKRLPQHNKLRRGEKRDIIDLENQLGSCMAIFERVGATELWKRCRAVDLILGQWLWHDRFIK